MRVTKRVASTLSVLLIIFFGILIIDVILFNAGIDIWTLLLLVAFHVADIIAIIYTLRFLFTGKSTPPNKE
jgi:hypothetical protein